jgi:tryptophan halogenase
MTSSRVDRLVIVGGGTAGWMTAAALSKTLGPTYSISLIESEEIGTVGVGEATIPMIQQYNEALQLDEADFVRRTMGSFKLGIEFVDWGRKGDSYIHGFGKIGQSMNLAPFYQFWLKQRATGNAGPLDDYSLNTVAARANKFLPASPQHANSPLADIAYAYHFDAALYAKYLREYAEARGVRRLEGKVASVQQHPESGFVAGVTLEDGRAVDGQLFIDCSGFRGLLIEQTLKTGYVDWSHWLPCNRAAAVQCERREALTPYTRSTAREAGWQWRIPLQHRVGNGYVFCADHLSEDEASERLLQRVEGPALMTPKILKFVTGKRNLFWNKNVVAVGLASGFMEPLESTSIHLIQSAIARLTTFFPHAGFDAVDIDAFNEQSHVEFDRIRDFLILHYKATTRDDTPFWRQVRDMPIPETLQAKIDLFRSNGRFFREQEELFGEMSWVQVMIGKGIVPRRWHALVDSFDDAAVAKHVEDTRRIIQNCLQVMPDHADFIARHCAASAAV